MRLNHLTVSHFLNHRSLNIPVDPAARVLFVCGHNGSGKTGIAQGIRLALTGQPVRGLQYKKDIEELITQGEKDGQFSVTVETNDGKELAYRLNLKTGNYSGSSPELDGSWLSLDPEAFIALPAPERRKLLFNLAGIHLKPETIVRDLVDAGHELHRVQRITGSLRQGFDAAAKEAQSCATEARGGWKAITGETYGSTKGASWRATVPPAENTEPVDTLQAIVEEHRQKVDHLREVASSLRHADETHAAASSAQEAKAQLPENEAALKELVDQHTELTKEVDALRIAASYKGGTTCPCPKCGEVLFWDTVGVLKPWDEAKPKQSPPAAHAELETTRLQLSELARRIERVRDLVASGKAAVKLLENLPAQPAPGAARKAEGDFQMAQAALAVAQSDLNLATNQAQEKARAAEKTKQAAEYHADVGAFALLADAITELPGKYLKSALKGVQDLLDEASACMESAVTIGEDMDLRYGTIPYGLASDSQQWRMRAAIGYALAVVGGLGIVVLDKFDVVQVKSRGKMLGWLSSQNRVQVVLCGTLKELPKLPEPPFQLVWLEGDKA